MGKQQGSSIRRSTLGPPAAALPYRLKGAQAKRNPPGIPKIPEGYWY